MFDKIRKLENSHILLWLIKDTCWVLEFKFMGIIMILPTVFVAFYLSYLSRHMIKELFHNLAVCCWILANSIWMIGEFFFNDSTRSAAAVFFILGISFVAIYYIGRKGHRMQDSGHKT